MSDGIDFTRALDILNDYKKHWPQIEYILASVEVLLDDNGIYSFYIGADDLNVASHMAEFLTFSRCPLRLIRYHGEVYIMGTWNRGHHVIDNSYTYIVQAVKSPADCQSNFMSKFEEIAGIWRRHLPPLIWNGNEVVEVYE